MSDLDLKEIAGDKKAPLEAPPIAVAHEACALLDGELKYGFRNWRRTQIRARPYINAMKRHIAAWEEGEEYASDSGVHHLGHLRATAGILLDAQECGTLIDDRVPGTFSQSVEKLHKWVLERRKKHAEQQSK